jgi:hypothetical protein
MIACTYENRPSDLTGVKLLALSLARHCPDVTLQFSAPAIAPSLRRWAARVEQLELLERRALDGAGWNAKPSLLLSLLAEGHDEVVWIDSDVILSGDFRPRMPALGPEVLVATEEPDWGQNPSGAARAEGWGLAPGRDLPVGLNSCLLRVTHAHLPLLRRWSDLLETPAYTAAQARPWNERPLHFLGDQEVLTALLASSEFQDVSVQLLRRGRDVVQGFSAATYTVRERLANGPRRLPPVIHAQRVKPWRSPGGASLRAYNQRSYAELSPYVHVAREYRHALDEPTDWMDVRTVAARMLRGLTARSVNLQGVPHSVASAALAQVRAGLRP